MQGKLAVISGFSGAGKGTVIKKLMQAHEGYVLSVSVTTRKPREGEVDGREYYFRTNEAFEALIEQDGFLEHAGYTDSYYGTPRAFVEESLRAGFNVLLEIEVQGAMQIRDRIPQAALIFVTPPNAAELERRLVSRGKDQDDAITRRLRRALDETDFIPEYPWLVLNDDADACAESIHAVIAGKFDPAAAPQGHGRVITDPAQKKAVAEAFRQELPGILARRS